jgi:hypothetical protein
VGEATHSAIVARRLFLREPPASETFGRAFLSINRSYWNGLLSLGSTFETYASTSDIRFC